MSERIWRERGLREAVAAGDQRAWQAWYADEYAPLERYVLWRSGSLRDLADDVLQETWLTAVRRIRKFDPELGTFHQWLCGIATNAIRNALRSRRRRPAEPLSGNEASADSLIERERSERIALALSALPERFESALRLKYLDGHTVAEIATASGETEKAVESLLTRARIAFREAYGHDG